MAEDTRPATPLGPQRIEQRRRIDLEAAVRRIGDVGGRPESGDAMRIAEQQPANLPLRLGGGESEDLLQEAP